MRFGFALSLLLLATNGCDLQKYTLSPSSNTPNAPALKPGGIANPSMEQQLVEIETLLKEQPDNLNLLKTKAIILQVLANTKIQNGDRELGYADYEESGEAWRKIKSATLHLSDEDYAACGTAIYNLGCALSLKNEVGPAISALREAVEAGFTRLDLIETDSDLDNLRDNDGFKAFVQSIPMLRATAAKRFVSKESLFPFAFDLPNFDGKTISSNDFAGKIVIVDVWATWCGPCRQEIPTFVALHQKYKEKGLEIVGINYEQQEDPAALKLLVKGFMKQHAIPYECVVGDELTQQLIPGFAGYPTTLIADRKGQVRVKLEGVQRYETLEAIVEYLLAESEVAVQ